MRDLEDVREADINKGVFDIYVDDIDFPNEQYIELRENDVVRLSDVDPYVVKDKKVFELIENATAFMKGVLDDVFQGKGFSVHIKSIDGYAKKLIECYKANPEVLNRIPSEKFKANDMIETFLIRELLTRFNKFELEAVDSKMSREEHDEGVYKYQVEYQKLQNMIDAKKAKKVFRDNLNIKPIE